MENPGRLEGSMYAMKRPKFKTFGQYRMNPVVPAFPLPLLHPLVQHKHRDHLIPFHGDGEPLLARFGWPIFFKTESKPDRNRTNVKRSARFPF